MAWERSNENPSKLMVRWIRPENYELMVTFYRDPDKTQFDDKEWNFVLDEVDGSKRKPLANVVINLATYASMAQSDQRTLHLKLQPISGKIESANLVLTISWLFIKAGNSRDDDLLSNASFDAISNCSYDDSHFGSLKRNHESPFERMTPGRSTTSFESGRRMVSNLFKSGRIKGGKGRKSKQTPLDASLPINWDRPTSNLDNSVVGNSPSKTLDEDQLSKIISEPSEPVIKKDALPSDYLKSVKERQEKMKSHVDRPVYEGTPPPSPPPPADSENVIAPIPEDTIKNEKKTDEKPVEKAIDTKKELDDVEHSQGQFETNGEHTAKDETEDTLPVNPQNLAGLELLEWCKQVTAGYAGVCVTNLTTSWRNGLAFAATIHHFRPDLIDWDQLIKQQSHAPQLVHRRILDAVLQLDVTTLPWEHGASIDVNAVPDRLLVTKFLYELRQKLSNDGENDENGGEDILRLDAGDSGDYYDYRPLDREESITSNSVMVASDNSSHSESRRFSGVGGVKQLSDSLYVFTQLTTSFIS